MKKEYTLQIKVKKEFATYFRQTADYENVKYGQFLEKIFNEYMKKGEKTENDKLL